MTDTITDYSELIDDEIWAFIEKTNASYPPDAVELSVAEQREVYDRLCASFRVGYPEGVSAEDGFICDTVKPLPSPPLIKGGSLTGLRSKVADKRLVSSLDSDVSLFKRRLGRPGGVAVDTGQGIPIRSYTSSAHQSPKAQIIYYHGGGFVVGGLESHDDVCAELCARTGLPLTAVDYRLAPEYTHPAAFEDALQAYQYISNQHELPVILVGDSAGATLAAAVSHAVRGQGTQPIGQVLIYPALGGDKTKGSYIEHADAPMLTTKDMAFYHTMVAGDLQIDSDPRINPLADSDFSALPPTTIITAQCDPLSDDGRDYRDALQAAGGQAEWFNEAGLVHGYLRARHSSARAAAGFTRIVACLRAYAM